MNDLFSDSNSDGTRDLLVRGIAAAKAKDCQEASFYLKWVLRMDASSDQQVEAWFWLSQVSTDPEEKRHCIESLLAIDPQEPRGRRQLAILDGKLNPAEIIDPDHPAAPTSPAQVEQTPTDRFTCLHCGGRMTFTPDGQSLTCEYCESRQRISDPLKGRTAAKGNPENDFIVGMATAKGHSEPVDMHSVTCKSCGASYILPADQMSFNCAYCGSSYALNQVETRSLVAPSGLIPFKVDENQARQLLHAWLEHNFPKAGIFVSQGRGLYLPTWAFDLDGIITWQALQFEHKNWAPVQSTIMVNQPNTLVLATPRIPESLCAAVNTYDVTEIVAYNSSYLANWPAETYQKTMSDAALDARKLALDEERQSLLRSFPLPIRNLEMNTSEMTIETYRLVLLPAWLAYLTIQDKRSNLLINGQTGAITSEHDHLSIGQWISQKLGKL